MDNVTGKLIKEKREEKRWTQTDLATHVGVTTQAVSSWEKGRTIPNIAILKTIAKELNCDVSELITPSKVKIYEGQGDGIEKIIKERREKEEEEIVELWRLAPLKTKLQVYQILSDANPFKDMQ